MMSRILVILERIQNFPTRWEDLPETIQEQIMANLAARVEAEERAKLEAQKQLTGPMVALEAEERAKLEAQKQLPAGEQTVDVTGD